MMFHNYITKLLPYYARSLVVSACYWTITLLKIEFQLYEIYGVAVPYILYYLNMLLPQNLLPNANTGYFKRFWCMVFERSYYTKTNMWILLCRLREFATKQLSFKKLEVQCANYMILPPQRSGRSDCYNKKYQMIKYHITYNYSSLLYMISCIKLYVTWKITNNWLANNQCWVVQFFGWSYGLNWIMKTTNNIGSVKLTSELSK